MSVPLRTSGCPPAMLRPARIYKTSASLSLRERVIAVSCKAMAEGVAPNAGEGGSVHIVYTERPEGEDHEAHHVRTLASVLGSEEAAKQSILYVYKNAAIGFSAKLTPQQVEELSKKPGVLQVEKSRTYQLHSGGSGPSVMD